MAAPTFPTDAKPAAILDTVGNWFAEQLPGFKWLKSRHSMERKSRTEVHVLTLQPSSRSRSGQGTVIYPRFSVQDSRLDDWVRSQDGERQTVFGPANLYLYSTLLTNPVPGFHTVEISGVPQHPELRKYQHSLDELLELAQTLLLPLFDLFATPSEVARALPDNWMPMVVAPTIEWALACGDRDAAEQLVSRHMRLPLRGEQTWERRIGLFAEGFEMIDPGPTDLSLYGVKSMGWVCRTHDLLRPEDLAPPSPPKSSPKGWLGRLGRRK